ncbi:MAG: GumC family protein [Bryobacteraceae bacterium]
MLQRQQQVNALLAEEEAGEPLTPAYLFYVLKRRAFSFVIPFVLLVCVGAVVALAWPAKYRSEGKVLILSPEIPPELVQPTVISVANERIQIIEQRAMTRDNLLAVAKKFNLSSGWRELVSGTEIIDFIRQRTKIAPLEIRSGRDQVVAFSVGFEYEDPIVATKVANEFLTMILNEDARSRTKFASETTRFLARDVERIEDQLGLLDTQIMELQKKRAEGGNIDLDRPNTEKQLSNLKAELAVKSATLSSSHPDILMLKRAIAGLEQSSTPSKALSKPEASPPDASGAASSTVGGGQVSFDTLATRRESLKTQLTRATQKLAAARLGESLERDRHSARLEVLEQPSVPDKPVSPNRPKVFGFAFLAALMAGGGLVVAREMLDQSIRSGQDIASIVDSHLIVPIPYISTQREIRRKKRNWILMISILLVLIVAGGIAAYFFLPPPDVWYDKVTDKVMKILLK